jgi:hypothetical protein
MLPKETQDAVKVIEACYNKLMHSVDASMQEVSNDYYGLKNSKEMVAELANPVFRKLLKGIKLLDKIIKAVADIINSLFDKTIVNTDSNLEENLLKSLTTLIDNFDYNLFNKANLIRSGFKYIRDNFTPVFVSEHSGIGKQLINAVEEDLDTVTLNVSPEEK